MDSDGNDHLDVTVNRFSDGGVASVDVSYGGYRHRLQGMDRYWVHDNKFGQYIEDSDQYDEGVWSAAYEATESGIHYIGEMVVLNPNHLWKGAWAPTDEEAREHGLI